MKFKVVLILVLIFQYNYAQITDDNIINVDESQINSKWENWTEKVPISGNVRVGLMVNQDSENNFKPLNFYVLLPKLDKQTNLCLEFSSKDGRYSGKVCFPIQSKKQDVYLINIPTGYKKQLSKFTTEEVVILASLNDDPAKKPKAYVFTSWTKFNVKNIKDICVYLNSLMPTRIALKAGGDQGEVVNCESLDPPTVAYNKKCVIKEFKYLMSNKNSKINISQRRKRGSSVKIVNYIMPLNILDFGN